MAKGIAFIGAPDGTILRVVRDDLQLLTAVSPGTTLLQLMEPASVVTARDFLSTLHHRHAAFDCDLEISVAGRRLLMRFAGSAESGRLYIVAAEGPAAVISMAVHPGAIDVDSQLYDDLSRLNNELANLQREMFKKNLELEKLNQQKNRILGMAAHDLRSPLGVILGYSEFLEAEAWGVLSREQRQFIAVIRKTSEFMLEMVTDMLDVTAIESGLLQLNREPTDVAQLVARSVALNGVIASRKKISVALDSVHVPGLVLLDAGKIEQVLNNLIGNAVKFSHGGSHVQVRVTCSDRSVTVAVQDDGQGIPASDLPKLFKPFGRTSVKSTGGEKSTGLGLAIVRKIVEGHGGSVWLETEVGKGSTFSFTLPTGSLPLPAD